MNKVNYLSRLHKNFCFITKHISNFVGSTKVAGWKPSTVASYFVYTVIAIHTGPNLLQLEFSGYNDGLENEV